MGGLVEGEVAAEIVSTTDARAALEILLVGDRCGICEFREVHFLAPVVVEHHLKVWVLWSSVISGEVSLNRFLDSGDCEPEVPLLAAAVGPGVIVDEGLEAALADALVGGVVHGEAAVPVG